MMLTKYIHIVRKSTKKFQQSFLFRQISKLNKPEERRLKEDY